MENKFEELTIYHVDEILNYFSKSLSEEKELIIDVSALNQIDACGLQLLIVVAQEAKIRGKPFLLKNPNDYLRTILQTTGAIKVLSLWEGD